MDGPLEWLDENNLKEKGKPMKRIKVTIVTLVVAALMLTCVAPAMSSQMGKININSADRYELMLLEGIGETYADRIIEYRKANGPFEKPEDLIQVKGIGPRTLELNKGRILVKDE
jgi:competence protein ComEA